MAIHHDLIGSREACRILNVDKGTLSRWVSDNKINYAHKLPGVNGAMLFHRADIEALAAARKAAS
jgi:excisionase family DNA binding protein